MAGTHTFYFFGFCLPASLWKVPVSLWKVPASLWKVPASLWKVPASLWKVPASLWKVPASLWKGRRKTGFFQKSKSFSFVSIEISIKDLRHVWKLLSVLSVKKHSFHHQTNVHIKESTLECTIQMQILPKDFHAWWQFEETCEI